MSSLLQVSEERQKEISYFFQTMNRSNGTHSDALAIDWLQKHGQLFTGFVNGTWLSSPGVQKSANKDSTYTISDLFSGKQLAQVHLPSEETFHAAEKNSFEGFKKWSSLTAVERSKYIYKIGKTIEENLQIFSVVESLATGKHLHKTRSKDVLNLIQVFYHDSTLALKYDKSLKPTGVICVVAEEFNNPLLSTSWRISSILAAGSSVFLLVDAKSCLSAFLLCEICCSAGLPPGVLNVLPTRDKNLASLSNSSKVVYTGSTQRSTIYIELAMRSKIPIEISTPRRTTVIVYSGADLHAAANSVLEVLAFNDTRAQNSGCNVLYQESIEEEFLKLMQEKFSKIVLGGSFTNSDLSCIVSEQQKNELDLFLTEEKRLNAEITFGPCIDNNNYSYYRPVLLCNAKTLFKKKSNDITGPIVFCSSFRTVKESISMFNHDRQASAVSLWVQNISVGLEVASKLKTTVVWMNSQNIFNPQVAHSSLYFSGNIDEGADAGLVSYLSINKSESFVTQKDNYDTDLNSLVKTDIGHYSNKSNIPSHQILGLFIGGVFKPTADKSLRPVKLKDNMVCAYVAIGSDSDVQNAVSCALAAQAKWENTPKVQCMQILISIAEELKKDDESIAMLLGSLTGNSLKQCMVEIEESIKQVLYYASSDTDCLQKNNFFQESSMQVIQHRLPLGVVGIQCPDENPLLSFLYLVLPAVVFRNAVVAIPSQKYPLLALRMCEAFKTAGVPSGLINVITGDRSYLTQQLSCNIDVGAIWFTVNDSSVICNSLKVYPKKIFHCNIAWLENFGSLQALKFATACTYNKAIYLPFGDIFAN